MPYCSGCGHELSGGVDYCPSCGSSVQDSGEEKIVNVNVEQSADHASANAASGEEGSAVANAETTDKTEKQTGSVGTGEDQMELDPLAQVWVGSIIIGLTGGLLSFMFGIGSGLTFSELFVKTPYAYPFWLIGATVTIGIIYAANSSEMI